MVEGWSWGGSCRELVVGSCAVLVVECRFDYAAVVVGIDLLEVLVADADIVAAEPLLQDTVADVAVDSILDEPVDLALAMPVPGNAALEEFETAADRHIADRHTALDLAEDIPRILAAVLGLDSSLTVGPGLDLEIS